MQRRAHPRRVRLLALAAVALLAGCSVPDAPPAATPTPPAGPQLTPTLAAGCASALLAPASNATFSVGQALLLRAEVHACGSRDRPLALAHGGACGIEVVSAYVVERGWMLGEGGSAWEGRPPCGRIAPAAQPAAVVPVGHALATRVGWNGTVSNGTSFRAAPAGVYTIGMIARGMAGEEWNATTEVTLREFCVDLAVVAMEPGARELLVSVDGETVLGLTWAPERAGEWSPPGRWCGVPGLRWLRVVDGPQDQLAELWLDQPFLLVRTDPIRVVPP